MPGFPRPFSTDDADEETFDEYTKFRPDHLPEPGPFLDGTEVLTDEEHVEFHQQTRDIFEERGVYDVTFGYNLARLNLDSRHSNAGWRYAISPDDASVLLAEFTPTTEFCPQSDTLTVGAFRAWNGLNDRHEYDVVSVAVAPMHHQSNEINEKLRELERRLRDGETAEDISDQKHATSRHRDSPGPSDDGPTAPF